MFLTHPVSGGNVDRQLSPSSVSPTAVGSVSSPSVSVSISLPQLEPSASIQELYADPCSNSSSVTDSGTNTSAGGNVETQRPPLLSSGIPDSTQESVSVSIDSAVSAYGSSRVRFASADFRQMGKELMDSSQTVSEHVLILPAHEEDFLEELDEIIRTLNWVEVESTCRWLISEYGKGRKVKR